MNRIIPRSEWGARAPKKPPRPITMPTGEVFIHHSAGALDANSNGVWWDDVRGIQNFHMDGRGWDDIGYSFLVGGGQIYEGRGFGRAGAHTSGHNNDHAICLIGHYDHMVPTDADLDAIVWLLRHGKTINAWRDVVRGHRDVGSTSCPGQNLYDRIPDLRDLMHGDASDPAPAPAPKPKPTPTPSPADWTKELIMALPLVYRGHNDTPAYTRRVQALCAAAGHPPANSFDTRGRPDGIWGSGTDTAVRNFQRSRGLTIDAKVGKNTWTALIGG